MLKDKIHKPFMRFDQCQTSYHDVWPQYRLHITRLTLIVFNQLQNT